MPTPAHLQRLAIEAAAAAALALHLDVRQEAHLDRALPGAFAFRAAPTTGVERKPARIVAADPRFAGRREHAADVIPEPDVGRRAGARSATDRRLVDLQHARKRPGTADGAR